MTVGLVVGTFKAMDDGSGGGARAQEGDFAFPMLTPSKRRSGQDT